MTKSLLKKTFAYLSRRNRNWFSTVHKKPHFILGNQKSGTSAIGNLVSMASNLPYSEDFFVRGNINDILNYHSGKISFDEIINRYRYEFSKPLIKDPDLTFFANDLIRRFPGSGFIFIIRNPFQNIRSILNRLKIPGTDRDLSSSQTILNEFPGWRIVLEGLGPVINYENHIEVLAQRWVLAYKQYLKHEELIHLVRYEDFLSDKKSTIVNCCEKLGIGSDHSFHHLLDHQFQPKGNPDVDLKLFFGEHNYQLIQSTCEKPMETLGY